MPSSGVQTCALRSEEHTSELQSLTNLVCRLLLEKKNSDKEKDSFKIISENIFKNFAQEFDDHCFVENLIIGIVYNLSESDRFITFFFFNDTATTEIYTLSLHDALPISDGLLRGGRCRRAAGHRLRLHAGRP